MRSVIYLMPRRMQPAEHDTRYSAVELPTDIRRGHGRALRRLRAFANATDSKDPIVAHQCPRREF
jgi:hypothetical protein